MSKRARATAKLAMTHSRDATEVLRPPGMSSAKAARLALKAQVQEGTAPPAEDLEPIGTRCPKCQAPLLLVKLRSHNNQEVLVEAKSVLAVRLDQVPHAKLLTASRPQATYPIHFEERCQARQQWMRSLEEAEVEAR